MKKFLALFLVLIMALSCALVACSKDKDKTDSGESDDEDEIGIIGGYTTTASTTTGNGAQNAPNLTWNEAAGDVYVVTGAVNVRSAANYEDNSVVATAKFGEKLTRIKYNDLWTVVSYGDVECYVATKYLTADKGEVTFTDVTPKTVYVNVEKTMNLRTYPYYIQNDDSNIYTSVKSGQELTQTGVSENGKWIRVTYTYTPEGKTEAVTAICYCRPANVSDTKPGEGGASAATTAGKVDG